MSTITLQQVIDKDPCKGQLELFKSFLGDKTEIEVTTENLKLAVEAGLDVMWAITNGLFQLEDQQAVLGSKDPELCYFFAKYVPGTDIKALQQAVIDSKDPYWCYHFARYVPGADIKALQQVVIDSKNPDWCSYFATSIPGADKELLMAIK